MGLLAILLLVLGLMEASSQLESLSAEMILRPGTGKTFLEGDLGDKQPLWWICLERHGAFGR